ncbi:helix-turn-helix transcriptional regulator [Pimelobacter simplex]|uniref:helix-turn-helix transcriptional regulator n=1 Tax=Nocardioides simplex TaxID=2045 RepID=UPI003AAE648B
MMTPEEYGRHLARQAPPLTPEQIEGAARILIAAAREQEREEAAAAAPPPPAAPRTPPQPLLLRIEEVSERIGVPVDTLRYWRKTGAGPKAVRLGRRLAYRATDVDAWVDEQFNGAGS